MSRHLRLAWSERIAREHFEFDHSDLVRDEDEIAAMAGTSWRPYTAVEWWAIADIVIGGDSGRVRQRSFEVYVKGVLKAIRPSLVESKQWVQEHYGDVEWQVVRLPLVTVPHPFGPTTEFTDPKQVSVANFPIV